MIYWGDKVHIGGCEESYSISIATPLICRLKELQGKVKLLCIFIEW
jgi:hypothetical protein